MEKRKTKDLDEGAILDLIDSDVPRAKVRIEQEKTLTPMPEQKSEPESEPELPIEDVKSVVAEPSVQNKPVSENGNTPAKQKRRRESKDYSGMFLRKRESAPKRQTYVNAALFAKITEILAVVATDLTVPTFLDNLLANHLEQYRDEINELYSSKIKTPL